MAELDAGAVFAGHEIEGVAGRGGMGVVYRARNVMLDRERALKLIASELSRDAEFRRRFQRESRLAASIDHPNVIPIHHAGDEDGVLYVAMRYVHGSDLGALMAARGPLDPAHALRLLGQVADALDAAHARGLVHRDVKPDNVLLEGPEGEEHAYLTDFGLSKLATSGSTLTASGAFVGTVDYVAPEQIEAGAVDPRTDIYALGCVLYQALTGEVPFPRDTQLSKMFAHANAERPAASAVRPELPSGLDAVLRRSMATVAAERQGSAGEVIADARAALDGGEAKGTARLHRGPRTTAATRGRGRLLIAAAALLGAVALAAVVFAVSRDGGGGDGDGGAAAASPAVSEPIAVGDAPTHLAVGDRAVWVTSRDEDTVTEIDPASERTVGKPIDVGDEPTGVAVAPGSELWVVNSGDGTVSHVDGGSGRELAEVRVGTEPSDVAIGAGSVWVTNELDDSVSRIDPARERVVETIDVGAEPRAVAVGEGFVWVTNIADNTLSKIDPAVDDTVGRPIAVGRRPGEVAVGEGAVWTSDNFDGTVTRVDPGDATPTPEAITVGSKPRGVAVGEGFVWVANGGDGTVGRIDPASGELVGEPVPVGTDPADLAIGGGGAWVANQGDATVQRISP